VTTEATPPRAGRDLTSELMEGSRWLRREQAEARAAWFEALPWEHKERTLLRFEMLLKGLVCLGNPVNHPGPPRRGEPAVARAFDAELRAVMAALREALGAGRTLAGGEAERAELFSRYLESILVEDHERSGLVRHTLRQDTPQQSLALLRSSLESIQAVAEGLAATSPIPYRRYTAVIRLVQREIHRSEYFDPLAALEFSAEFDRLQNVRLLEILARIPSIPARRAATLVFLALFRLLSYLELIEGECARADGPGSLAAFVALLRSDGRALSIFLRRDAASWLAGGFGRLFQGAPPATIHERYPALAEDFERLKALRELLGSMGNQLRLELRKVYEQQLPAIEELDADPALRRAALPAAANLRSFVQNAVVLLAREFAPDLDGDRLFTDYTSDRVRAERLRRDIWMFQQILRAFGAKARGTADAADRWAGLNTLRFVREFVSYFKSMGYQLLRYSDYAAFNEFMAMVERLRDGDVLDVQRLAEVTATCDAFNGYLEGMFEAIGRRAELGDVPFDKRDAARTLKLFLGH
jgi:hypothetical protein